MVAGSHVKAPIAALHRRLEFAWVADIPLNALEIDSVQTSRITAGAQQGFNLMSQPDEHMYEVAADKAGGAGYEAVHALAMITFCAVSSNKFTKLDTLNCLPDILLKSSVRPDGKAAIQFEVFPKLFPVCKAWLRSKEHKIPEYIVF